MKFMLLIYSDETPINAMAPAEQTQMMAAFQSYTEALVNSGVMVSGNRLQDVSSATTLRTKGNNVQTIDGPFAETKEQLGGYYLIEAPDLDAAIKWAKQCPAVRYGAVEVRPLWETPAAS